ncbi:MAG: electron transport complex subunit RsxC [Spirochaetes bacterium]|nr:electron transport complex subunit RsxC [Spirochaetota bacterium]
MTKTFKGGVHPPENKKLTDKKKYENLSIPSTIRVPLLQHIGKPAVPVVNIGDIVEEGQLIAKADGFISANIHAPLPGKVTDINLFATHMGRKNTCIVIEVQGNFGHKYNTFFNDWPSLDSAQLLEKVIAAGIVGMGGAAFPTHVKLSPPAEKPVDCLLVNAAECEPFLTVDDNLVKAFPDEIIEGIEITLKILKIRKAVIGIENNKKESFNLLKKTIASKNLSSSISIKMLKTKYPQGSEKQLIQVLTGRVVPSGRLPMDVGVVVQNVGTVFAINEAVIKNKPLYERYITVTGSAVKKPGNYKVKIGTPVSEIIDECGGLIKEPGKVIMGGPMCGLALSSLDIPVVKGTSGILVLTEKETSVGDYCACIRCGRCVQACPVNLLPLEMANAAEFTRFDLTDEMNPLDCIMCGSCAYVCPSGRPINHFIKLAQNHLRNKK